MRVARVELAAGLKTRLIALGLVVLAAGAWGVVWWASAATQSLAGQQEELKAELARLTRAISERQDRKDFVQSLPLSEDPSPTSVRLHRLTTENKVELQGLIQTTHTATASSLPRHQWDLTLRGTYPHIKATLAAGLDSTSLYVQELTIKRLNDNEVEARAVIVRWLQPPAGAASKPRD